MKNETLILLLGSHHYMFVHVCQYHMLVLSNLQCHPLSPTSQPSPTTPTMSPLPGLRLSSLMDLSTRLSTTWSGPPNRKTASHTTWRLHPHVWWNESTRPGAIYCRDRQSDARPNLLYTGEYKKNCIKQPSHQGIWWHFQKVVSKCRLKVMQKNPLGVFCINFNLHLVSTLLKGNQYDFF